VEELKEQVIDQDIPVEPVVDVVEPETEPAKAEPETEPATPEPKDEYQKIFDEEGLGGQFADPKDALRRIKDTNRWSESVHRTNQTLQRELEDYRREKAERQKPPPIDAEKFMENFQSAPLDTLRQTGVITKEELAAYDKKLSVIEEREQLRDLADAIGEYPELRDVASGLRIGRAPVQGMNRFWDAISEVSNRFPGLERAGTATALSVLFPEAKKLVASRQKPPVDKVSQETKERGKTTPAGRPGSGGTPDFGKMSADQIRKWYDDRNMTG